MSFQLASGPSYTIPDHLCISVVSDWGFVYTAPYESDTLCSCIRYDYLCKHPHSRALSVSDSWKRSGMKSDPISCKPGLRKLAQIVTHFVWPQYGSNPVTPDIELEYILLLTGIRVCQVQSILCNALNNLLKSMEL